VAKRRGAIDRVQEALSASAETKQVEFKETFNPADSSSLCETIKDILALANTGGGVIVVGVDNTGMPTGADVKPLLDADPADLSNKITKYTGLHFDELTVRSHAKAGRLVATLQVGVAAIPLIPVRPGTYEKVSGKQATAFSVGVVYVRHGAKSEPATSQDIERIIEHRLRAIISRHRRSREDVSGSPEGVPRASEYSPQGTRSKARESL
jgi:predicted HTH transcriptional regulator